jgi:hypothetical protein
MKPLRGHLATDPLASCDTMHLPEQGGRRRHTVAACPVRCGHCRLYADALFFVNLGYMPDADALNLLNPSSHASHARWQYWQAERHGHDMHCGIYIRRQRTDSVLLTQCRPVSNRTRQCWSSQHTAATHTCTHHAARALSWLSRSQGNAGRIATYSAASARLAGSQQ